MSFFSPVVLISLGLAIMVGFAISGYMVARGQSEEARLVKRIGGVLRPHDRTRRFTFSSLVAKPKSERRAAWFTVSGWFGFDPTRKADCPLPWWLVLAIALVVAKLAQMASAMLVGSVSWLDLPVVWIGASRWIFGWFRAKRRAKLLGQFPDALAMIVRSVRVGVPVTEAMRVVARETPEPTGPEFETVVRRLSIGAQLDETLHEMASRTGLSEYRFFAMALALQNQTGGGLSEALEGLAEMIRKRLAVKERGKALASEAQMSIYVLSSLPPLCGLALSILNPRYFMVLIDDPSGQRMLGGAIALLVLGWFLMRTMMQKSLS
ncbi:MAG: type II secretion system F family protein [Rhodospirillales bacterium]|nr:type II secretion system F family protein [Rhodospirillales bacterium]